MDPQPISAAEKFRRVLECVSKHDGPRTIERRDGPYGHHVWLESIPCPQCGRKSQR